MNITNLLNLIEKSILTPSGVKALHVIATYPGCRNVFLVEKLDVSHSLVSSLITKLKKHKLIKSDYRKLDEPINHWEQEKQFPHHYATDKGKLLLQDLFRSLLGSP